MDNFFILICARAGSKGIKKKNLVKINGKSLVGHAVSLAKKISKKNIMISSDSDEILNGEGINDWGSWSSWTFCPPESAVCGLQTKIHDDDIGEFKDDAGLTNIKLICCKI